MSTTEEQGGSYANPVYGVNTDGIVITTPTTSVNLSNPTYGSSTTDSPPSGQPRKGLPPTPIAREADQGFDNPGYIAAKNDRKDVQMGFQSDTESVYSDPSFYSSTGKTVVLPKRKVLIAAIAVGLVLIIAVIVIAVVLAQPKAEAGKTEAVQHRERLLSGTAKVTGGVYQNYLTQYADNESDEFRDFATRFEDMMERGLKATAISEVLQTVRVKYLESGSVLVYYEMFMRGDPKVIEEHTDDKVKGLVVQLFSEENSKGKDFKVDLNTIGVSYGPSKPKPKPTDKPCIRGGNDFEQWCGNVVNYKLISSTPLRGYQTTEYIKALVEGFRGPNPPNKDCQQHAMIYICEMIFPRCVEGKVHRPCKDLCEKTYGSCGNLLPAAWLKSDCSITDPNKPAHGCPTPKPKLCGPQEFRCMNGPIVTSLSKCIDRSKVCDKNKDCVDGADEINCQAPTTTVSPSTCGQPPDFTTVCGPLLDYSTTTMAPLVPQLAPLRNHEYMLKILQIVRLADALSQADHVSDRCRRHMVPFWCHLAYPKCDATGITQACKSYCLAMFTMCQPYAGQHFRLADCELFPTSGCMPLQSDDYCDQGQFMCRNGPTVSNMTTCINADRRCNTIYECSDGSDEKDCPTEVDCPDSMLQCVSDNAVNPVADLPGQCYLKGLRCNNVKDCLDGSDEKGCEETCPDDKFQCLHGFDVTTGSSCIDHGRLCDGTLQCTDGSDEDCDKATKCLDDEFRCATGVDKYSLSSCILASYRCDGNPDCVDGSDEKNCQVTCSPDQFKCITGVQTRFPYGGSCIENSSRCDGMVDCADHSDEDSCTTCPDDGFRCKSGALLPPFSDRYCTPAHGRCNGVVQCEDESDENDNCGPVTCATGDFQCTNGYYTAPGGGKCVPGEYRCDRKPDCSDKSDEAGCEYRCPTGQFMCKTEALIKAPYRGFCIPDHEKCDGHVQCHDESDEHGCPVSCTAQQFDCGGIHGRYERRCIALNEKCDGQRDCADGRDEGPGNCDPKNCPVNHLRCKNGRLMQDMSRWCYPFSQRCDGTQHCMDDSDEAECGAAPPSCEVYGRFQCANGFYIKSGEKCIPARMKCDRVKQCSDGSDENDCTYDCKVGEFRCASGTVTRPPYTGFCIGVVEECDGHLDCADASDEVDCSTKPCPPGLQRCPGPGGAGTDVHNGDLCIESDWICDGSVDCSDLSDETLAQCNLLDNGCQESQHRCNGTLARYPYIGYCIDKSEICDGHEDCTDGNDEPADCASRKCPEDQSFRCGLNSDGTAARDRYNGDFCIPQNWVCDGGFDCTNLSDELSCGSGAGK